MLNHEGNFSSYKDHCRCKFSNNQNRKMFFPDTGQDKGKHKPSFNSGPITGQHIGRKIIEDSK